ncbi:MAG TPA: Uma2 family endonuclease [Gemmataceae bacterium]|jgi:Uma2 family endonuclease|nr:Uma2 family endonuclease [Gemmataceae bacterium]
MSRLAIDSEKPATRLPTSNALYEENRDEVWDGVLVMSPIANNEHQQLTSRLGFAFQLVLGWNSRAKIFPGINLSDRVEGWQENYRIPDIAVYLPENTAIDCETHWCGGPDFGVEIVSDDDRSLEKLPFYAKVNTQELLIVDRDPWCLSLYRLQDNEMVLVGKSSLEDSLELVSAVLPLSFRLIPGDSRPAIEVTSSDKTQRWEV